MFRSEDYLSFIRTKPCAMCRAPESVAHHEPMKGGGMGLKAEDSHAIPLCPFCHRLRHDQGPKTFWRKHDVPMMIIGYLTEYAEILEGKA